MAAAALPAPAVQYGPKAVVNFETPHVHPLERTPDGASLLAVNTAEGTLMVFSLATGTPVLQRTVPVGVDPVSVRARHAGEAWVVNRVSNSISIVDLASGTVSGHIDVCRAPGDVVFAAGGRAVVSCTVPNRLMVIDAATRRITGSVPIAGESPRALALSADGGTVYAAIFESANGSTVLAGDTLALRIADPVRNPFGPYRGASPIPNAGAGFNPPRNPAAGMPPPVSAIVEKAGDGHYSGTVACNAATFGDPAPGLFKRCFVQDPASLAWSVCANEGGSCRLSERRRMRFGAAGFYSSARWRDDTNGDWTALVTGSLSGASNRVNGWDLVDRDVAVYEVASGRLRYQTRLLNAVMSLSVNPANQEVYAIGTDATNLTRFEPVLNGVFLRVNLARFRPGSTAAPRIVDLNPHLDYRSPASPRRTESIGDPRGIAWTADGRRAFISGMGSNNLLMIDAEGRRQDLVEVGQGPTGVEVDDARQQVYVLNKFDASISVVSLGSLRSTATVPFFDPTPTPIKAGRPFLYNTHIGSGNGHISCASCHIDGKTDRLAWDLGNPAGAVESRGGFSFHPLKGPMKTQSLQNIIGSPSLHHRGDKADLFGFAGAFANLQGLAAPMDRAGMALFEAFLAEVAYPPNPNRLLDNRFSKTVALPGPLGSVRGWGDATRGFCGASCHLGSRGRGDVQGPNQLHLSQPAIPETMQGLYERIGLFWNSAEGSTVGTGNRTSGAHDSMFFFEGTSNESLANMLSFEGPTDAVAERSANAHAGVGLQAALLAPPGPAQPMQRCATEGSVCRVDRLLEAVFTVNGRDLRTRVVHNDFRCNADTFGGRPPGLGFGSCHLRKPSPSAVLQRQIEIADSGTVGLVFTGTLAGQPRGGYYLGGGQFQTDRLGEISTVNSLLAQVNQGARLVFTLVPRGSEYRIGVDANLDGRLNAEQAQARGPVATAWRRCAAEGGQCELGTARRAVRFGAAGQYAYGVFSGPLACNRTHFGDPALGAAKACEVAD